MLAIGALLGSATKKKEKRQAVKHRGKGHPEAQYSWSQDVDDEIGLQAVMTMANRMQAGGWA
jgi:hypothetical protein